MKAAAPSAKMPIVHGRLLFYERWEDDSWAMKYTLILLLTAIVACSSAESFSDLKQIHFTVTSSKEGLDAAGGKVCIITAENSSNSLTAIHPVPCFVDVGEGLSKITAVDRIYKESDRKYTDAMFITEEHKKP